MFYALLHVGGATVASDRSIERAYGGYKLTFAVYDGMSRATGTCAGMLRLDSLFSPEYLPSYIAGGGGVLMLRTSSLEVEVLAMHRRGALLLVSLTVPELDHGRCSRASAQPNERAAMHGPCGRPTASDTRMLPVVCDGLQHSRELARESKYDIPRTARQCSAKL